MTALCQDLLIDGTSALDTGLCGRYHASIHRDVPNKILAACNSFVPHFGDQYLVRSNTDGQILPKENTALVILQCVLVDCANWYSTISTAASSLNEVPGKPFMLSIGTDAIPQSITRSFQVAKVTTNVKKINGMSESAISPEGLHHEGLIDNRYLNNAIAVVGMACKFPGADSADEFWSLLTEGKSMLGQMPKERFAIDGLPRSNGDFRFWGNFVRDIDAFDHKLFKKSSREAASMDPQQRLLLQVAYEALESSGYFADPTKPRNIGCYLGACSTDYDHNVASHPPTAYSTIGTLRAFLSGKISHYFGWSGPSLTFDTACSSSAVAIHTACTALPTDECSQAMAGGVTLLTSPYLYENLATAHFLSPTGATKPFDATADGYCRGEGLGLVVLKRLSDALTNGDAILGIVASSAINQNDNCVPITVPHSSSQGTLYKRVVDQAGILPNEVTFVEAHGTGTPVGDPIEMESIRHVFGGQMRSAPLFVSSVKGNIGHLEGASGVAALIKALLQIEHRTACTQASFKSLNTKIPALEPDKICIPTSNRALPGDILTACINNYGAAGSNAAMMLVEAPRKHMWQQSSLLRSHLDLCDEILRSMGYQGLYPGIFQVESVTDMAALHSMVFSIQYACAQAWLNSGLRVDALIGHSIGQIAALCVSGVLSLRDGLILIAGRASLMRKHWGSESGTMIAVETDQLSIEELTKSLTAVNVRHQFEIACYNGPTSHVIVSDEMSADELEAKLVQRGIRHKRLNVAYGFHSRFTDPLLPHLENLASSLVFNEAKIPLETCTDKVSWSKPTAQLIASHTRDAVFFGQAVQRLYSRLGVCTWLEAGSESSVVGMVRRVFGHSSPDARNNFVPMQLNKPNSLELLVDTTLELWNHGHQVQFWNFHRLQTLDYDVLRLPSYRFEKSRHWLKLITAPPADSSPTASVSHSDMATSIASLVLFIRFVGMDSQGQHFDINPRSEEYQAHVKGHIVMGSALCPSMLYVEMASRAIRIAEETKASCPLSVQDLRIESPLDRATDKKISVDLQRLVGAWSFRITSKSISPSVPKHTTAVCHATGVVSLSAPGKSLQEDFARYERLTGHDQIAAVFEDGRSESVQGTMVYKVFSSVVSYSDCYRGVKSMASKGSRVVGRVSLPKDSPESFKNSLVQPHILDNFIQVASLFANCIYEGCEDETFWLTRVDRIQSGPDFESRCTEGFPDAAWDVLAFNSTGAVGMTSDIFVYDAATRRMVLFILGARFTNSRRVPLAELLSRADEASADITIIRKKPHVTEIAPAAGRTVQTNVSPIDSRPYAELDREARGSNPSIHDDICALLEKLADIPRDQVAGNASFDDLGVDSLMMIEVINNLSTLFHIDLPHEDLEQLTDIDSLVQYLHGRGCVGSTRITSSSTYATSSSGTSASSVGSIAIATPPEIPSDDGIDESLCRLVAEHLEMETALTLSTNLVDHGLDSLLCIELQSDIRKHFSVEIDIEKLDHESTFADLLKMVLEDGRTARVTAADSAIIAVTSGSNLATDAKSTIARDENLAADVQAEDGVLRDAQQAFENIRFDFDKHAEQTHFKDFWKVVYPKQANLVLAFVVEAFRNLGCDLAGQSDGQQLPSIDVLPKHGHLLNRLRKILVDGGLISRRTDHLHVRTSKPIDSTPAATLSEQMLEQCPWNASETKLLNVTASRLTDCLTGNVDPLQLLFANKANRNIVADVYEYAPMCQATTRLLAEFLLRIFSASPRDGIFRILEVGAGTGGTARYLVDFLTVRGIRFEYTFTDISSALVNAAKKRFSGNDAMRFMALDCGRTAEPALLNKFDVVIATNCIHATANATVSSANIATMLRDDGVFCLVEFTRDLYWFDLVYGLLEGWWLFSDGRQHALADEWFWDRSLRSAGYKHVSWTDGTSKEAQTMRLICSFKGNAEKSSYTPASRTLPKRAGIPMETFVWKRVGNLDLQADVYFPKTADEGVKTRPIGALDSAVGFHKMWLTRKVALMVHGGGHFLFSRKDIPMKHVRVLLQRGFLPISVDYRLCPEVNLFEGPITDVCDSLQWIRETLPSLQFCGPIVRIDPDKVIAIGWSSGGQLVMTLGYMASTRGIRPPDAILALYSPTDLESDRMFCRRSMPLGSN